MDKLEKERLKHDRFQEEVGHGLHYVQENRKRVFMVLGVGILLIALGFIGWGIRAKQHTERQEALREALRIQEGQVGGSVQDPSLLTFPTQAEKDTKAKAAFTNLAGKYSGTDEGAVAEYYLGVLAAQSGNTAEADQHLQKAIKDGSTEYSAQAKFSLAQLYESQGRSDDAEKLLRDLVAHPTAMVSKEQATISLARVIGKKNPEEARKMLEPLRTERPAVSRVVLTTLSELPKSK